MKQSDSHLRLSSKLAFSLQIPVQRNRATGLVKRALIAVCLTTLVLGLTPLLALLLTGPYGDLC